MKLKNNASFENYLFEEEVSLDDISSFNKSENELLYLEDKKYQKRINLLSSLAIFLIVSALLFCLFAVASLNKDMLWDVESDNNIYNLSVMHSNNYCGGFDILFSDYSDKDHSFDYSLYVSNKNDDNLFYNIMFVNPYFGHDSIDMTTISYSLIINNIEISSGKLQNKGDFILARRGIANNTDDNIIVKLWSKEISSEKKFNFKINIEG